MYYYRDVVRSQKALMVSIQWCWMALKVECCGMALVSNYALWQCFLMLNVVLKGAVLDGLTCNTN